MQRISKFLSDSGIASRREAEKLIAGGKVFVNGARVETPVFFVSGDEEFIINGKPLTRRSGPSRAARIFAFNKPINTITSRSDPQGRKTVYDALNEHAFTPVRKGARAPGFSSLKYIGRLDYKTTGLLLLTDNGELARMLTLPESGVKRVYEAKLHPKKLGEIKNKRHMTALKKFLSPLSADDSIFDPLRRGITIDGMKYASMKVELLSRYPLTVKIVLMEGKKNEIRIAFEHIGLLVAKLHRTSYGKIELGGLKPGEIRELSDEEVKSIP
jgi:23S rRNA pseudouridine2605 synthase